MKSFTKKKYITKILFSILLPLSVIFYSGCAGFKGNKIAEVDITHKMKAVEPTKILFKFDWYHNGKKKSDDISLKNLIEQEKHARSVVTEGGLFEIVNSTEDAKYTLEYSLNNHGNEALAFLSGFISGFSFLVIPGVGIDNWTLEAKLLDKDGSIKWTKTYEDKMTAVTWIPLLPIMFSENHNMFNLPKKILANIYRHPLSDINEQKLL